MAKLAAWAYGALGAVLFSGMAAAETVKDADRAQLQVSLDERLNEASYEPYAVSGSGADAVIRPSNSGDQAALKGGYVFREGVLRVPADKDDPPGIFLQISLSAKDDGALRLSRLSLVSLHGDTNLQPMLTSESALCNNTEPVLVFRNHGWGTAAKASVSLRFTGGGSPVNHRAMEFSIGDLADAFGISIRDLMKSAGHDLDASLQSPCALDATRPECAAALADEANPDPLLGVVSNEYQQFSTTAAGTVKYEWTENGATKTASDEFEQPVTLGLAEQMPPMNGAYGGEPSPMAPERVSVKTISVKLDRPDTKVPIDLRGNPSATQRVVSLKLVAPRSAKIEFAVLAKFKDGSEVQSDPVHIDYFRPRPLTQLACGGN